MAEKTAANRRRIPRFYLILLAIVILVLLAVRIGQGALKKWLKDYEESQPKYVAEEVFSEYFENVDFNKLLAMKGVDVTEFETENDVVNYLRSLCNNEVTSFFTVSTGVDTDQKKYVVKVGEKKLSAFTLVKSGKKSAHGFDLYELDPASIELSYYAKNQAIIQVPVGCTVYLNDVAVAESYRYGEPVPVEGWPSVPEGLDVPSMVTYRVEGLYSKPRVRVVDAVGEEREVTYDAEKKMYTSPLLFHDAELHEEFDEYVTTAMQKYSCYMQFDGSFGSLAPYFDADSALYENIRTSEVYFVWEHERYWFEDVNVRDYYRYDENTFSVRISYTHWLHKEGKEDFKDYVDMTIYLHKVGDEYKIFFWYGNN